MKKNYIIGEVEIIAKSKEVIQIAENLKGSFRLWTLKIAEGLKEQLEENKDIKPGLTVMVTFTDETKKEINKISYIKNLEI